MVCRRCKKVTHISGMCTGEEEYDDFCDCEETLSFTRCLRCQEIFLDFLERIEPYTFTVADLLEYDDERVN
jgi:hypothetical protein